MVILVVDDYADTREMLKVLLETEGHTILEAANGREAVEIAKVSLPDVILMDLAMPVMDGLAATRILRGEPETSSIRIVAITAHGNDPGSREAALRSGCNAYYAKPLDLQSLNQMLRCV